MKKILLLIIPIIYTSALYSQQIIIRLAEPAPDSISQFYDKGYDIAAYRPGEYLDLVVSEADLTRLRSQGYDFNIYVTEAEMAANLVAERDIPGYRTYAIALAELQQMEIDHPGICKLYNLGNSRGKEYFNAGNNNYINYQHDIWALKLSSNVDNDEDKPAVFYMGAHHAREPLSTEVTFYVLNHLLQNYGVDPDITNSINSKEIWFIPIVNPDGHKIVLDQVDVWWRKNIRDNNNNGQLTLASGGSYPDGVDPNRNYGWEWGGQGSSGSTTSQAYRGPSAFSEPEVDAMKDLIATRHFVAGITYHTYSELVLWPYGYVNNAVAPDAIALAELGTAMAATIPRLGSGYYTPQPSWALYAAAGVTDDYAYGQHGIFCYTIELATQFIPPASQVVQVCEDNLEAALILLNRIDYSTLTGHVTDAVTGDPLVAEVFVEGIDNTGLYREPYRSNVDFGRYYRMLPEGDYTVTFSSLGYFDQTFSNVNIYNLGQTVLHAALQPQEQVSVSGIVTNAMSGIPVVGATIEVSGSGLDPVFSDINGSYMLENFYEGTYNFKITAPYCIALFQEVVISAENIIFNFTLEKAGNESFESGDFNPGWTFTGNTPWLISETVSWDGNNSAESGEIDHNQVSSMIFEMETTEEGTISFYRKVSSEADYDFLRFYINDVLQDQWSGNQDWQEYSYTVNPGLNGFRWTYLKDGSVSTGSDRAWVDFIRFPLPENLLYEPPLIRNIQNIVLNEGNLVCYDATETITISDFVVSPGGAANVIAGINVILQPGTAAQEGSYFSVRISDIFCSQPESMLASEIAVVPEQSANDTDEMFFRIFPNPTSGRLTLEYIGNSDPSQKQIEIFNMMGEMLFQLNLTGKRMHEIDMSAFPNGIYLFKVMKDASLGFEKVIKY